MHYLKTQVKDKATALPANLQVSDNAFQSPWELLNTRYTNPRRLLDMHIDDSLDRQPLTSLFTAELGALLLANKKSLDAIALLGIPIDELNPFLIFITVRYLSTEFRVEWMVSLGLSNEFLTNNQLHDMLKAKVCAWENSEIGASVSTSQSKAVAERLPSPKSYARLATINQQGKSRSPRLLEPLAMSHSRLKKEE